jgi:hypothetical protein
MLMTTKILLTIATLGYSAIPAFFDSNNTHATNPSWTGHARFHVVWQVSSYVYIGLLALVLVWSAGSAVGPLWIATLLAAGAYGGFWTAYVTRPIYNGGLVDEVNGVPPFLWNIAGRRIETDANVTIFAPVAALVIIIMLLLTQIA